MRGGSLLLTALLLVGAVAVVVSPARAGDNTYVVVRAVDDHFEQVGLTCAGDPTDPPELRVGLSTQHVLGHGSLAVTTTADAIGGVLVKQPRPLRGVMYWVLPPAEGTPQGQWRVEVDDEVLTSDPVDLAPGEWGRYDLDDATLHDGHGWTGTIEQYVADHGSADTWAAGLLTGGCLGSESVRLDSIGTRKAGYDFEARVWVTLRTMGGDGRPLRIVARAHRYDPGTDTSAAVAGARVTVSRRGPDDGHFRPVATGRTDDHGRFSVRAPDRPGSWRASWRRAPRDVPSDVVQVR